MLSQGETVYYSLLSKSYMSDESDDPDSMGLVIHRPLWRSQRGFAILAKLFNYSTVVHKLHCRGEQVDAGTRQTIQDSFD